MKTIRSEFLPPAVLFAAVAHGLTFAAESPDP